MATSPDDRQLVLEDTLREFRRRVNLALDRCLPNAPGEPSVLHDAMRYAVMNGGKRVRPTLVYATGTAVGTAPDSLDDLACAVELIHAYSLVHDDLPAMDDDDLRRGNPTCHKKFDEATAILAGDALQALAFSLLADGTNAPVSAERRLQMIGLLASAAGADGMAWGQAIDLEVVGKQIDLATLENMHRCKTGALIRASVKLGALSNPDIPGTEVTKLDAYAGAVGLAFQIVDDILDITADTDTLGKPQGSDIARDKPTYPALLGLDGAREHAMQMHRKALDCLDGLPAKYDILRQLSAYVVERSY